MYLVDVLAGPPIVPSRLPFAAAEAPWIWQIPPLPVLVAVGAPFACTLMVLTTHTTARARRRARRVAEPPTAAS